MLPVHMPVGRVCVRLTTLVLRLSPANGAPMCALVIFMQGVGRLRFDFASGKAPAKRVATSSIRLAQAALPSDYGAMALWRYGAMALW